MRFSWIHLEGRNRETLLEVLKYLNQAKQTKFSVEVEKVGRGFEDFIPWADIVFVSKVRHCRALQDTAGHYKPLEASGGQWRR